MYVLEHEGKPRVAFILPPKTGTRSIERELRRMGATRVKGRHAVDGAACTSAGVVFSTTRHPCDVLVSWYHYEGRGEKSGKSFAEYMDEVFEHSNGYLDYSTLPGAEHADKYIRYEKGLQKAINHALQSMGYAPVELSHIGRAKYRRPWQDYYTPELLSRVRRRYASDFFNYYYECN